MDQEYVGYWHLPGKNDDEFYGSLKIDEHGQSVLKISQDFNGIETIGDREGLPIILGHLSNGKQVTLLNNIMTHQIIGFPGFPLTEYKAQITIIGECFDKEEDIYVKSLRSSYSGLCYWIGCRPFAFGTSIEPNSINVTYTMPESLKCKMDDYDVILKYVVRQQSNGINDWRITQEEFVDFLFMADVPYKRAFALVDSFADFLTLCVGKRVDSIKLLGTHNTNELEFFYKKAYDKSDESDERDPLIPLTLIGDNFDRCISAWSEKRDLLLPVIAYFVDAHEVVFHEPMSFLKMVQAVEAYSRRMRCNYVLPPEEFDSKVQSVLSKIDSEDDRKFLQKMWSNEPRLRTRLEELFQEVDAVLEFPPAKIRKLIHKITVSRNYYTHFDEVNKPDVLDTEMLLFVTKLLRFMLRILLLQDLGLNSDETLKRLRDSQELIWIKEGIGLVQRPQFLTVTVHEEKLDKSE